MEAVLDRVASMKEGSWYFVDGLVESGFLKATNYSSTRRMEGGSGGEKTSKQTDGQTGRRVCWQTHCPLPSIELTCRAFGMRLTPVTILALTFAL